jgi:hypothetical protein
MRCPGSGAVGELPTLGVFLNWARTFSRNTTQYTPNTLPELVATVQRAEAALSNLKAVGSVWSYTGAAVDDSVGMVVQTSALRRVLSSTSGDPNLLATGLIPFALRDVIRADPVRRPRLVHVEAGITIHDLNNALDGIGLAMPTLGGANGQTLAGAVSTGTHGSDVDLPPIADGVRAVHMVGPGGQEWWLEPAGELAITDLARMTSARDGGALCPDIRIVYDNDLFRAALVSLGRMGVFYSVVLECVPAFNLIETRDTQIWSTQASWIRANIRDATAYAGPRFLEIVVNPYRNQGGDRDCVVTRRDVTTAPITQDPGGPGTFNMFCSLESMRPLLGGLAALLPGLITVASGAAAAAVGWIPIIGPLLAGIAITIATAGLIALEVALIRLLTSPGENLGEKLAEVCNLAARVGHAGIVRDLIAAVIQAIRPVRSGVVQKSYQMLTGQGPADEIRPDDPVCMRQIDGLEFCLDLSAGRENLFQFMDDVFALVDEFLTANTPVGLALSLRFTRRTTALLGMQQFNRNCLIEFIMLRGLDGNPAFLRRLHVIAERRNAIPHWGLIHDLDARKVHNHYGSNHRTWQRGLERILESGGRAATFRTRFSIDRDLEPAVGCVLPRALTDLIFRVLLAIARLAAMSRARG